MRIYCDTSALLKRSFEEPESNSLERYLEHCDERGDSLVTSALTWVEVNRAIRARHEQLSPVVWTEYELIATSGMQELAFDAATLSLARRIGSPALRSLDAIHLASAIQADADLMLTYDNRLESVAIEMGIRSALPLSI